MTPTMTMTEVANILHVDRSVIYRLRDQRRFDPFPESLLKPFGNLSAKERLGRLGVQPENMEGLMLELDERQRAASRGPDDFCDWPGLAHPEWAEARKPRSPKAWKRRGRKKRGTQPVPVVVTFVLIPVSENMVWNASADLYRDDGFVHLA